MEPLGYLFSNDAPPNDMKSFRMFMKNMAKGVADDWRLTHNSTIGKSANFAAGVLAASHFAKETGTLTPLNWALRRFGPLPLEFTRSGTLQIFTLTLFQRTMAIAIAAGAKFVVATFCYEGGVVVGSVINQFLSQKTKDAIGGTLYGIICEEGWKDLWRHPFGYGVVWGPNGERLINY